MIFQVRILIEPYALKNYGSTISETSFLNFFNEFSKPSENLPKNSFYATDDNFHRTIVTALPNHYLLETYNKIQNQNLRFRIMTGELQENRLKKSIEQHLSIVSACIKKDWNLATDELTAHLAQSKDATLALLNAMDFDL